MPFFQTEFDASLKQRVLHVVSKKYGAMGTVAWWLSLLPTWVQEKAIRVWTRECDG